MAGPPQQPCWPADPTGAHALPFHDGTAFTPFVSDHGVVPSEGPATPPDPPMAVGVAPPAAASAVSVAEFLSSPPDAHYSAPPTGGSGPVGGPPVGPGPSDRRTALWVAIGIGIVEAMVITVLTVALATQGNSASGPIGSTVGAGGSFAPDDGHVVYSSTFGPDDGWDTGAFKGNTVVSLSPSRYAVLGSTDFHYALLTPYATGQAAMAVEASVTDRPGADVSFVAGFQSTTGLDPALAFQVMVYPDGRWYLEETRIPGSVSGSVRSTSAAACPSWSPAPTVRPCPPRSPT